jgi:hypothetical protein
VIWDCFTFDDELDVLECRLTELDAVVDRFVLCESPMAQSDGSPKPMHFADNAGRFRPWLSKIAPLGVILPPAPADSWERERAQRNAIREALNTRPEDLIMYSDVDEIPSAAAVADAFHSLVPVVFAQHACYYAVDWVADWPWLGTCAFRPGDLTTFADMRERRTGWPQVAPGGWHLSWLGGPDAIRAKIAHRAHTDEVQFITEELDAGLLYEKGLVRRTYKGDQTQLWGADVDDSWPVWVAQRRCPPNWFRPRPAG